jgi:hypothetical protein
MNINTKKPTKQGNSKKKKRINWNDCIKKAEEAFGLAPSADYYELCMAILLFPVVRNLDWALKERRDKAGDEDFTIEESIFAQKGAILAEMTKLIGGAKGVVLTAYAGNDRAKAQLRAIHKLMNADEWGLTDTDIEKVTKLKEGKEFRRKAHAFLIYRIVLMLESVAKTKKGIRGGNSQMTVMVTDGTTESLKPVWFWRSLPHNEQVQLRDDSASNAELARLLVEQGYWKKGKENTTLSVALRIYGRQLKEKGLPKLDARQLKAEVLQLLKDSNSAYAHREIYEEALFREGMIPISL